jgi:hypothetical protein
MLWAHLARQYPSAPAVLHIQTARYLQGCGAPEQTRIASLEQLQAMAAQADKVLFYLGEFPTQPVATAKATPHLRCAWRLWGACP